MSVGAGVVVVGGGNGGGGAGQGGAPSTIAIPGAAAPIATVGGQPILSDPSDPGAIVIGGGTGGGQSGSTTIRAGDPAQVIDGTPVSVAGGSIVVGTQTVALDPASGGSQVVTIAGTAYTVTPGQPLVVDGTTILPGGPAVTIQGTPVSIAPAGIVVGGSSVAALPAYPAVTAAASVQGAVVTLSDGRVVTASAAGGSEGGALIVDGTTLLPGGPPVTIDGTVLSAAAGGSGVVVNGQIVPLSTIFAGGQVQALITAPDGSVLTATRLADGVVRIGDAVLSVGGPPVTVDGVLLSLGPGGVVMGTDPAGEATFEATRTVGWTTATATGADGLGSLIVGGLQAGLEALASKSSVSAEAVEAESAGGSSTASRSGSGSITTSRSASATDGTETDAAPAETSSRGGAAGLEGMKIWGTVGVVGSVVVLVMM